MNILFTPSRSLITPITSTLLSSFSTTPVHFRRMPPKKKVEEKKVLLGRPGNNLKIGIVGLPNVGKSSFFNLLTKTQNANAANFPYATIDPEEARIPVPDQRFEWLCQLYKPKSTIPAHLTINDIAGIAKGASTGAGLGNAFLSHIRAVDGIFQMVRAFDDAEVIHTEGDVDPVRDMIIIQEELRLKDIEWVEKSLEALKKVAKTMNSTTLAAKSKNEELATVEKALSVLTVEQKDIRHHPWTPKEVEVINTLMLLTAKPCVYLVNVSERDYVRRKSKHLASIMAWLSENAAGDQVIPFSVSLEERLAGLSEEDQKAELEKAGAQSGALGKITKAGFAALQLDYYYTCGPDEVRCWNIRKGTLAPRAAGVIHSDFEDKFVCGEIMNFEDLKEAGSEAAVKAAGKYRQVGRTYEMQNGDIAYWKSGR